MSGKWMERTGLLLAVVSVMAVLAACGQGTDAGEEAQGMLEEIVEEEFESAADDASQSEAAAGSGPLETPGTSPVNDGEQGSAEAENKKEMFGEDCIAEQVFSVSLSEYDGDVWFVPFAPSAERPEFWMQIVQDGGVLTEIAGYVPARLSGETFVSLDAVSFYDLNFDGFTDIVLIETYGDNRFAAVYYGFETENDGYEGYFWVQEELSEGITAAVSALSISGIRDFLTGGKKNGEFSGYQEAYETVGRLCGLEGADGYDLIYVDDDGTPELAACKKGYHVSLYTYEGGTVYNVMDRWAYGAMGNAGYEYLPRSNRLRNYNSDYAGAIMYATYMEISSRHSLETVSEIKTVNFDDVNGNGMPDPEEEGSIGYYGISYIDGREATDEECAALAAGEYEYIEGRMSLEELLRKLNQS